MNKSDVRKCTTACGLLLFFIAAVPWAHAEGPVVRFEPIELKVKDSLGNAGLINSIDGSISLGEGMDLFWSATGGAYIVKQKGSAFWITPVANATYGAPCWDGAMIWIPVNPNDRSSPSIILYDPKKLGGYHVGREHGLPYPALDPKGTEPNLQILQIATVKKGSACVCGSDGAGAFVASIVTDSFKGTKVKVLLTAKESAAGEQANEKTAFRPVYMLGLDPFGEKDVRRILIGRGTLTPNQRPNMAQWRRPLLVDLEAGTVKPTSEEIDVVYEFAPTLHDGSIYWVSDRSGNPVRQTVDLRRLKVGVPRVETAAKGVYSGTSLYQSLAFDGKRVLMASDGVWSGNDATFKFEKLDGIAPGMDGGRAYSLAWSSVYQSWLLISPGDPVFMMKLGAAAKTDVAGSKAAKPRSEILGGTVSRGALYAPVEKAEKAKTKGVVFLGRPDETIPYRNVEDRDMAILAREIVRQAFLISAREELGLSTRDEVLDERDPNLEEIAGFELESFVHSGKTVDVSLRLVQAAKRTVVFSEEIPLDEDPGTGYLKLVASAEKASRNEMALSFKKSGAVPTSKQTGKAGKTPPEAVKRAYVSTFLEQYESVRLIHDAVRTAGESSELLQAIVVGYAQLGLLTQHHWSAAHKVFKARSLLYAQRLMAKEPASPESYWSRGFALALTGFHKLALDDFATAQKKLEALGGKAKAGVAAPAWLAVVEAYCKGDLKTLDLPAREPLAPLARTLRYMILQFTPAKMAALESASSALEAEPENYLLYDAMSRHGGVATLHASTESGIDRFSDGFPRRLKELSNTPAELNRVLADWNETNAIDALVSSGDPTIDQGEPSWTVLGELAREARFVLAFRRLHFMKYAWDVPVDGFLPSALEMSKGHRYRAYLEALGLDLNRNTSEIVDLLKTIKIPEAEDSEILMFDFMVGFNDWRRPFSRNMIESHRDPIAFDLAAESLDNRVHITGRIAAAKRLLAISPNSADARAELIREDWDHVQSNAEKWERELPGNPTVLYDLCRRYMDSKRMIPAERCLKELVKLSPERWAYESLADIYLEKGDCKRWKETLDEFLEKPEIALNHVQVQVRIADQLMKEKKWKEALPYSLKAASSWALWAMECAQRCYEGLEDWDNAELWARRATRALPALALDFLVLLVQKARARRRPGRGRVRTELHRGHWRSALLSRARVDRRLLPADS